MINFINVNQEIRLFLTNVYMSFYNSENKAEASIKYYEFIENIKMTDATFYNFIIGLCFIDSYRILIDKKNLKSLDENEKNNFEIYEQINDMDDLIFNIEKYPSIMSSIIYAPIKINQFNTKGRAIILSNLDPQYISKFNHFNYFEQYNMFKERTSEEFIIMYLNSSTKEKNETIYNIINILDLLYQYNLPNFYKLIVDMIKVYYRYKKVLQHTNPELTFGIDEMIIKLIETKSLNDIVYELSCNTDMLSILVEDFLNYSTDQSIAVGWIDSIYKKIVSKDIKIKLKEA